MSVVVMKGSEQGKQGGMEAGKRKRKARRVRGRLCVSQKYNETNEGFQVQHREDKTGRDRQAERIDRERPTGRDRQG
ncbi:hypothetical protein V495_05655 [Pseudogymnoascus sp. VKM F-4514 (FW-929)]|nr:hypothetical protein V495_05655 [Pseudogymnoascus sp. VKM F-4514 (FW-929)]